MTRLTVPVSQAAPGAVARAVPMPEPTGGAAIEQLGRTMFQVGTALEEERLGREMQRHQVDLARDLNGLRLEAEGIGDPDAAERHWQQGVERLRGAYAQPGEDGRPRVDPKNAESFGVVFDDLSNRHAFSLGRRTLGLRYAERAATEMQLGHEMGRLYAEGDAETREVAVEQYVSAVQANVAAGVYDAEEGQRRIMAFRENGDNARAIALIDADPEGYQAARAAGEFAGLQPDRAARYDAQAQSALDTRAAAAQREAERAAEARQKEIGSRLGEIRDIAGKGFQAVDEAFLSDPEVQAHPEFAQTAAKLALREEGTFIDRMSPPELRQAIAAERAQPVAKEWQTERVAVMEAALARAEQGLATDPVAYRAEVGEDPPELPDPSAAATDPEGYAAALGARLSFGERLAAEGYTDAPRYFTNEERAALIAAAGPEAAPEDRVALARQLPVMLGGSGENRPDSFEGLEMDPTFKHMARFLAAGGAAEVAKTAFRGQQALAEGNVRLPTDGELLASGVPVVGELFATLPGGEGAQRSLRDAANAHYAATARLADPKEDFDADAYARSLFTVAGGVGEPGSAAALGGIQPIRGKPTVLPPGVSGARVETVLNRVGTQVEREGVFDFSTARSFSAEKADRFWRRVSGGRVPRIGGEPLDREDYAGLSLEARPGGEYILVYDYGDGDLATLYDDRGAPFTFDLGAMMREARP